MSSTSPYDPSAAWCFSSSATEAIGRQEFEDASSELFSRAMAPVQKAGWNTWVDGDFLALQLLQLLRIKMG